MYEMLCAVADMGVSGYQGAEAGKCMYVHGNEESEAL